MNDLYPQGKDLQSLKNDTRLKGNFTPYIYTLIFALFSIASNAQEVRLDIGVADSLNTRVLNSTDYEVFHEDTDAARTELDSVRIQLQLKGYIGNRLETLKGSDSSLTAVFRLGPKTENISLSVQNKEWLEIANADIDRFGELRPDGKIQMTFERLPDFLQWITDDLESKGQSFARVRLTDIRLEDEQAEARLNISFSQERSIDKIVIRGYDNFPKNFVRHQLGLVVGEEFSRDKLDQASKALGGIPFAQETRPPEVLFTKDSTLIYLYIEKSRSNRFDGIIGFASKEERRYFSR